MSRKKARYSKSNELYIVYMYELDYIKETFDHAQKYNLMNIHERVFCTLKVPNILRAPLASLQAKNECHTVWYFLS